MEPDQITSQDALHDDVLPGEDLDNVPGWEWDVEEEPDLAGQPLVVSHLPDGVGGQHQMVVMDPDQWHLLGVGGKRGAEGGHRVSGKQIVHFSKARNVNAFLMGVII